MPQPCSALVSFIHAALAVHTYASRGFAKCKAHNNLFACAIYSDKELFLPQRWKKSSREGTNASIRQDGQSPPDIWRMRRFCNNNLFSTKRQPRRSRRNNPAALFLPAVPPLALTVCRCCRLALRRLRDRAKQGSATRSALRLRVVFADTRRLRSDVCLSGRPERRRQALGLEELTSPSTPRQIGREPDGDGGWRSLNSTDSEAFLWQQAALVTPFLSPFKKQLKRAVFFRATATFSLGSFPESQRWCEGSVATPPIQRGAVVRSRRLCSVGPLPVSANCKRSQMRG